MQLEIVRDTGGFERLKEQWNALLLKSDSRSIFLTWEWLFHWWRHFGGDKQLHIVVAKNSGDDLPCAIAPLCIRRQRLPGGPVLRRMRFLGAEKVSSDFLDFIVHPGHVSAVRDAFAAHLLEHRSEWDIAEFSDLEEDAAVMRFLRDAWHKQFTFIDRPASVCPFLPLAGDYAAFVASLSSMMRYNLRRKLRKYGSNRWLTLSTNFAKDDVLRKFDEMFSLHGAGFRRKQGQRSIVSNFQGEEIRKFHHDIVTSFDRNGWLRMYYAGYRDRLIGCIYAYRYKGRLFYYQSGLDRVWDRWSVGTVLLDYCIKDGIADRLDEFHFLRGKEEYKFRWTDTIKMTRNVVLINTTLKGLLYGAMMSGKTIAKQVKHTLFSRKKELPSNV